MDPKEYPFIIFDFDETIATIQIDWEHWYQGIEHIYTKYDPNYTDTLDVLNEASLQNKYIEKYGKPIRDELLNFVIDYEKTQSNGIEPNESIVNLIRDIDITNHNLFIWSSNSQALLQKYLSELKILSKFKKVIARDDVFYIKPATDGFDKINSEMTMTKDYLFIGDSISDEIAAHSSNIAFLNVKELNEV